MGKLVTHVCGHIKTFAGCNEPSRNRRRASHKCIPPVSLTSKRKTMDMQNNCLSFIHRSNATYLMAFLVSGLVERAPNNRCQLGGLNLLLVGRVTSIGMILLRSNRAVARQ